MLLLATRNRPWMRQCDATLQAVGIPSRWLSVDGSGTELLEVPDLHGPLASEVLSEQLGEELRARAQRRAEPPAPSAPLLLQPPFAAALVLATALLLFFFATGPFLSSHFWFAEGALMREQMAAGEWWRIVTAATLHSDLAHGLGNALFVWLLGWAAAERVGPGLMVAGWLLTAVAGMAVSLWLTHVTTTLGASGGLFGLLGIAAGSGVRKLSAARTGWRDRIRLLGAAVSLLAFTAFSPESNIHAHLGGFACGLLFGLVLPKRPARGPWQWLAGLASLALVVFAWQLALAGAGG